MSKTISGITLNCSDARIDGGETEAGDSHCTGAFDTSTGFPQWWHSNADSHPFRVAPREALPKFRAERARVRRSRVEMFNRLLQPRNNLGNRTNRLFRQIGT
jgi:hypothetical protein